VSTSSSIRVSVGWAAATLTPAITYLVASRYGLKLDEILFLAVFSATMIMWLFRIAPEFVPCIFCLAVLLILDIAPANIVLSGFASEGFFMAMSVFGIAAVFLSSGLLHRLVLVLVSRLPATRMGASLAIFLVGLASTVTFPTANGRLAILTPMLMDLRDSLGQRDRSKVPTELFVSMFFGAALFSSTIMTSKTVNFVVLELLPEQARRQFTWLYWLEAAVLAGVVLLVLYWLFAGFFFRFSRRELTTGTSEKVREALAALGPMQFKEWCALGGLLGFVFFVVTSSVHKIEVPWLTLAILYIVLAFGLLSPKEFQIRVKWGFLIYLGGLVGIAKTMAYLGLDHRLVGSLSSLGILMRDNFVGFTLALFATVYAIRLLVPNNVTVAQLAVVLFPLAQSYGVNPWVVGFLLLIFSDGWLFPYQCTYYVLMEDLAEHGTAYDKRTFLRFNAVSNVARLAAALASIGYWKWLGIIQ
jgi:di/tricarboxylate transporter